MTLIIEMNMNSQINPFTMYRTEREPITKKDYIGYASGKKSIEFTLLEVFFAVWYSMLMDVFSASFSSTSMNMCTRKKCLYLGANRQRAYLIFICLLRPTPIRCFYHITLISTILPWCASFCAVLRSSSFSSFLSLVDGSHRRTRETYAPSNLNKHRHWNKTRPR